MHWSKRTNLLMDGRTDGWAGGWMEGGQTKESGWVDGKVAVQSVRQFHIKKQFLFVHLCGRMKWS